MVGGLGEVSGGFRRYNLQNLAWTFADAGNVFWMHLSQSIWYILCRGELCPGSCAVMNSAPECK